jgi:hypothetical protein
MSAKKTGKHTRNAKTRSMAEAAEAIRKRLGLTTLADRNRDDLDFHEMSVARLREVIAIAFEAGWDAGFAAATTLNK